MSMFSVDINSANGANYIRPKKGASAKVATQRTPVDMTKSGSLFNAPNLFTTEPASTTTTTLTSLRTSARTAGAGVTRGGNSIFNGQMNFISGGDSRSGSSGGVNSLDRSLEGIVVVTGGASGSSGADGDDDLGIGRDASKGRAAAKALKKETSDLRSSIAGVENSGDEAGKIAKRSQKLNIVLQKTDAKFKETEAKQKAELAALEQERAAVIEEMTTASKSIDVYSRELEAEIASGSGDMGKIASLRSQIREKNSTLQIGNSKVNIIGRSSRSLISDMARTSKAYIKTNKAQQKSLDKTQEQLEKTLEVAAKIEGISSIVETTGAIIENLGIIFKACAAIPFVGAALAAAGAIMEPIGATGKAIGQWGKVAAQVTQTVAYASAGMVQQAFMSAASAIQTGTSAVQSTKQAVGEWGKVGASLKEVKADVAEAKAKRAEKSAEKAQAKADKENAWYGRDKNGRNTVGAGVDENGNSTGAFEGKTKSQLKADAKAAEAKELRAEATERRAAADKAKEVKPAKTGDAKKTDGKKGKDTKGGTKTDANNANSTNNVNKQVATKSKSMLKAIFSQEGLGVVCQSLSLAGMIIGMSEANKATGGKNHKCSDFEISARAQKIVAKTMSRMGYTRPGMMKVSTR